MAALTSKTISLTGIVHGVGANFGPFSRRERSAVESGFCNCPVFPVDRNRAVIISFST